MQTPLPKCEYYMDFKCLSIAWITLHQHNGYWDAMNYFGKLGFCVASSTHQKLGVQTPLNRPNFVIRRKENCK